MAYSKKNTEDSALAVLKKRIKENATNGVYLFWGAEEYTKDHYAEKLRASAKSSPLPEFNYVVFDASRQDIGKLEEAIYAPPYLWENKVVELRELQPATLSAADGAAYAELLANVPPYLTVLIFLRAGEYGSSRADRKGESAKERGGFSKLLACVQENGLVVEFVSEKGERLCQWIAKHFASRGVRYAAGVPSFMIAYCGSDMYTLQGEIAKLCEVSNGQTLTEQDVRTYCCANESYLFFDVAACLTAHDPAGAKRILSGLRMTPDAVTMAIGYLASTYQQMLLLRTGMDRKKSAAQLAAEAGIPAWRVNRLLPTLAQTGLSELQSAVAEIARADQKLKTLRGDPSGILELLLYRICAYGT